MANFANDPTPFGSIGRMRNLALTLCRLTQKATAYENDITDLLAEGLIDEGLYNYLCKNPWLCSPLGSRETETCDPGEVCEAHPSHLLWERLADVILVVTVPV